MNQKPKQPTITPEELSDFVAFFDLIATPSSSTSRVSIIVKTSERVMNKAIKAVKEWMELETVGAFEIMQKHDVAPKDFWEAYRSLRGGE